MPNHINRWGGTFYQWSNQNVGIVQNFGSLRDDYVFDHIGEYFNLDENSIATAIKVFATTIDHYFNDLKLILRKPIFIFSLPI